MGAAWFACSFVWLLDCFASLAMTPSLRGAEGDEAIQARLKVIPSERILP
jgi:hypothetical protein